MIKGSHTVKDFTTEERNKMWERTSGKGQGAEYAYVCGHIAGVLFARAERRAERLPIELARLAGARAGAAFLAEEERYDEDAAREARAARVERAARAPFTEDDAKNFFAQLLADERSA